MKIHATVQNQQNGYFIDLIFAVYPEFHWNNRN